VSAAPALSLRAEAARKALHLATAVVPMAWALGAVTTPQVRTLLTGALAIALLVEAVRRNAPAAQARFEALVGSLLRAREQRAITGATWLAFGMTAVAWFAPERAAIAALWAAAVGDAAAALVGRGVAFVRRRDGASKSLAGALACAVATGVGAWWLVAATPLIASSLGAAAAAAEWPARPGDDNLRITLVVAAAAMLLGLR
jgi:dolichol kinase